MSDLMPTDDSRGEVVRARRQPEPIPPRHAKHSKFGPGKAITGLVLGVVAVILVSTSAVGAAIASTWLNKVNDDVVSLSETDAPPPDIGAIDGGFNILIVGSDTRQGQGGLGGSASVDSGTLNDVNILVHVAQDQTNATVVSFPRDLEVSLPDCARWFGYTNKLNTALSQMQQKNGTGLACVAETVEDLTGLDIQFAGLITFRGVVNMADAVGGVEVCTTGSIKDPYSGLTIEGAGNHLLAGEQALAFLRTRHGVGDGSDWSRVSSQQVYMSSLLRKIKSDGTLTNPGQIWNIANAAIDNMQLSAGFADPLTLVSVALALKNIPEDRISFVQYPTSGTNEKGNAVVNKTAASQLMKYIKADQPFQLAKVGDDRGSKADPNAPTTPATPDPAATATAAPPTSTEDVPLLQGVTGQTGADYSCAVANR